MPRQELKLVAVLMCVAALVRVPGLLNELWLDEVWSLTNALSAHSWIDIFTQQRTDNNHHLISLWMYLVGEHGTALIYRFPSFICGLATIGVVFVVGRSRGLTHGLVTATLFGLSFPFVYYSSEARGYAAVVFFTAAAWLCLRQSIDQGDRRWAVAYWICCAFGVLAHQTFVEFFIAALLWGNAHAEGVSKSVRAGSRITLTAFVVPGVLFGLFYFVALRGTSIAGGPRSPLPSVVAQALSLLAAGPMAGLAMWAVAFAVTVAFVTAIGLAYRRGDDVWLMYAMGGVVVPALFVAVQPSAATYTRYFLVPGVFVLFALADVIARATDDGGLRRFLALASLCALAVGCLLNVRELWLLGRGRYDDAVRRMAEQNAVVTVASAPEYTLHDFRGEMLIGYYTRVLGLQGRVRYLTEDRYPLAGSDWMIRESINGQPPEARYTDRVGNTFIFDREYQAAPLAGIAWWMYKQLR